MSKDTKNSISLLEEVFSSPLNDFSFSKGVTFKDFLEEQLKPIAAKFAYSHCNRNQTNAAKLLGWNRGTFRKYFEKSLEIKRVPYGK